jgi:UDP-N-acetylglucosamine 4,6-dehydratase
MIIKPKKIVVMGACGTWGQEFTKQLVEQGHEVIGVDRDEKTTADYVRKFPEAKMIISDHGDFKLDGMGVDVLVFLSAYKHINLIEENMPDAIHNNVTKTAKLLENAHKNNVKVLYVSTDKAVAPYSVYGFTKAIAERLTWFYGGAVARSGNIAGSNGSVVHVFREQVRNNQPLTVTDMGMERYFIKIEDAVRLSWAGFLAGNRLTLVDIGGKVKLGDIINNVLAEFGHNIDTYQPGIKIIGLRADVERLSDDITWSFDNKYLEKK